MKKTKAKTKGKGPKYHTMAPTMPVAPTTAGSSTHHLFYSTVGGKAGASKKQAKKSTKGRMVA